MNVHKYLPQEVRSIRQLYRVLPNDTHKYRVMGIIKRYTRAELDSRMTHKGSGIMRWRRESWDRLFVSPVAGDESAFLFVEYHPDAVWLYRGDYEVERDLYGDQAVVCRDTLRLLNPIYSKFSVDNPYSSAENGRVG